MILKRKQHLALFVLSAVTLMSVKLAMALVGKAVWEIIMTTMELASTKFLVEIVAMDIQKETVFAISANKGLSKGYF